MKKNEFNNKQAVGFILAKYLFKKDKDFEAIKLGLVDNKGNILREPENEQEVFALNTFDILLIILRDLLISKTIVLSDLKYTKFYSSSAIWGKIRAINDLADYNVIKKVNNDIIQMQSEDG